MPGAQGSRDQELSGPALPPGCTLTKCLEPDPKALAPYFPCVPIADPQTEHPAGPAQPGTQKCWQAGDMAVMEGNTHSCWGGALTLAADGHLGPTEAPLPRPRAL